MGVTKVKEPEEEKPEEKRTVKPKRVEKPKEIQKPKEEIRELIRVAGTDLDGSKSIIRALKKIKGISYAMSKIICAVSGIDANRRLGSLTESEIKNIEEIIKDPIKFGIPPYVVNRRKDRGTGRDIHLTGPDLEVVKKFDIQRMVDMKSYKGSRHMFGLPVRGQRTRSSFRKGKVVGVVRKAVRIVQEKEGKEKKE